MIFLHCSYETLTCVSPDVVLCLDPLDPKDWWTSLDVIPREVEERVEGGTVAVAGGAIGPEAPWPASDWTCLGSEV